MKTQTPITVEAVVAAPIEHVWTAWTEPEHIVRWAFASDDWAAPYADSDLRVGGKFVTRMEARDQSAGFDFGGTYTALVEHQLIEYDMNGEDRRHVKTTFEDTPVGVKITQTFDPETENIEEVQRAGWQAILDNFKNYAEKTV